MYRADTTDLPVTAMSDVEVYEISEGAVACLHPTRQYKSTRIDFFLTAALEPKVATQRALTARILERGTTSLPGMRELNRFIDNLYGASFAADIDQVGGYQVLHVMFDVVDGTFLSGGEDVLGRGFSFLADVLLDPCVEGHPLGFSSMVVAQEKAALRKNIESLFSDKMAYAQRQCIELMCPDEPYGISPYGRCEDLSDLNGISLLASHRGGLCSDRIDIYVSGAEPRKRVIEHIAEYFTWPRIYTPKQVYASVPPDRLPRKIVEVDCIHQGKLVWGFRTGVSISDDDYPALVLFNLLLGADGHSRLHQSVRERHGLCYHIASFIEPLCALLFIEAGVDAGDCAAAQHQILVQLEEIRQYGPSRSELDRALAMALQRLSDLSSDRESLIRFHFTRSVAGVSPSRAMLSEAFRTVTPSAIAAVAQGIRPDTTFFLSNQFDRSGGVN